MSDEEWTDEQLLKISHMSIDRISQETDRKHMDLMALQSIAASLLVIARNSVKPDAQVTLRNFGKADGEYTITPKPSIDDGKSHGTGEPYVRPK